MKYAVSAHQQRIAFIDQFERGTLYKDGPVYHNIPILLRFKRCPSVKTIQSCLGILAKTHEVLRTRLAEEDGRYFQALTDTCDIGLEQRELPAGMCEENVVERLRTLNKLAFRNGIKNVPLIKAFLMTGCGEKPSYLLLSVSHFICDAQSARILERDFRKIYLASSDGGEEPVLPKPNLQYIDFSSWQNELDDAVKEQDVNYWLRKMPAVLQPLKLPIDTPRAAVHIFDSQVLRQRISSDTEERIRNYCKKDKHSCLSFYLAVFKLVLSRFSRQTEINIGTLLPNRPDEELANTVGPLANLVLLHDEIDYTVRFPQLLEQVGRTYAEAEAHSTIPFEELVMAYKPENDMSRTALFDVLFDYYEDDSSWNDDIETIHLNEGYGKYDYHLQMICDNSGTLCLLTYNSLYYREQSAQKLLDSFIVACDFLSVTPDSSLTDIPYVSMEEIKTTIERNANVKPVRDEACLQELFSRQAALTPDKIAVRDAKSQLSYFELDRLSDSVAAVLREAGVQSKSICALLIDKDILCIAVLLGVLKAGAAYLPIAPDLPPERITFMLNDSRPAVLIAPKDRVPENYDGTVMTLERLTDKVSRKPPFAHVRCNPEDLAYIIYTSGTTGKPKGMMIEHRNVAALINEATELCGINDNDVWTMFHSYNFDFSVWEMYGALLTGGLLYVVAKEQALDTAGFRELLRREKVTILSQTPSAFYALSDEEARHEVHDLSIRRVIFGGESLHSMRLSTFSAYYPALEFINMYGITETTVHVTFKRLSCDDIKEDINSIGVPLPSYTVSILDEQHRIVPDGVPGEIAVGGSGVGRAYLYRPELTAERFREDLPNLPGRIYLSGDLGRYKSNGEIEYLGRGDMQVKIRGFRIEPGEVEAALMRHEDVREAVVLARKDVDGQNELAAYMTFDADKVCTASKLSKWLSARVADYMIPVAYYAVETIPINSNGKIDRRALISSATELERGTAYCAPETQMQMEIAEIWGDVLKTKKIGINDNFFSLGGNSLMVTKLIYLLEQRYGRKIEYRYFFTNPTVSACEAYLLRQNADMQAVETKKFLEDVKVLPAQIHTVLKEAKPYWLEKTENTWPQRILLTGATGFLGAFLLHDFLAETDAVIYCLVRAENAAAGMARIREAQEFYRLPPPDEDGRIIALPGDLAVRNLGMSQDIFAKLARTVDLIFHCGAIARQGYSYDYVRGANVLSVNEIIRLAGMVRPKPIHYISTLSVFNDTADIYISEDEKPGYKHPELMDGYMKSKIVAESMLAAAAKEGLSVSIYRPGRIGGALDSGSCQTSDFLWQMIKASEECGCISALNMPFDMMPVDQVSQAIFKIWQADLPSPGYYNLCWQNLFTLRELSGWLQQVNPDIKILSANAWMNAIKEYALQHEKSVSAALLPVLNIMPEGQSDTAEQAAAQTAPNTVPRRYAITRAAAAGARLSPPEDFSAEAYFKRIYNFLKKTKFL